MSGIHEVASRLSSDIALVVILAVLGVFSIVNSVFLYSLATQVATNEKHVIEICSSSDILNDTLTNKFKETNRILDKRNGPEDVRLHTINEIALNDIQDSAEIIGKICD
jgi:hypothetical protein